MNPHRPTTPGTGPTSERARGCGHSQPHGHDHHGPHGHTHGVIDATIATMDRGIWAISRSVPEAGIMFAVVMMTGVALTLSSVALATGFFRQQMGPSSGGRRVDCQQARRLHPDADGETARTPARPAGQKSRRQAQCERHLHRRASEFFWRLQPSKLHQQQQIVGNLQCTADEQWPCSG